MIDALTGQTLNSEDLFSQIDRNMADLGKADIRLEDLGWRVNAIHRAHGRAATLQAIENEFTNIESWATEAGKTPEQIVNIKMRTLLTAALKNPDDDSSGRGNDAKRLFNEGRREMLVEVRDNLYMQADKMGL